MDYNAKLGRDIKPLINYRNDAWKCVRCGLCRMIEPQNVTRLDYIDQCPSGMMYKFELFYPAGKQDILRCLTADPPELEGPTDMLLKAIFACTGCGSCQAFCNNMKGLQPTNSFQALKAYAVQKWGARPAHHNLIQSIINYDNPWQAPRATRSRWTKKLPFKIKDATKEKVEVLYFPGCNASYVPEISTTAQATARVLHNMGIDFGILGQKERCCGSTAFRVGADDMFTEYMAKNVEQLNALGIKTMVTACAGCHSTFSHNYAGKLNFEVVHIVEYLERMIAEGKLKFTKELNIKATYHDPCHIGRYSGIYDPPRRVLQALPGVKFKEMNRIRNYSLCCGSGGGVKSAYPEMALSTAAHRLEEAKVVAEADVVVSCCPFCEINLGEGAKARGDGMKVVDLLDLVDQATSE